jgi:hypothetical protein
MQRTAILYMPKEELVDLLNLPDDSEVEDIRVDFATGCLQVRVSSATFREVPECSEFPMWHVNNLEMAKDPSAVS